MTDADTPRVPDLWWTPSDGCICRTNTAYWSINNSEEIELPADAVKLGDVSDLDRLRRDLTATLGLLEVERETREAAESELDRLRAQLREAVAHHGVELGKAWRRTEQLRADIRAVLDDKYKSIGQLDRIRAAVDREPGREATLTCPHCRTIIRAMSGSITQADVDQHLADCEPAWQFARECATAALAKDRARAVHGHVVEHQPDTPCGRNDKDCGMRGGTAHCQGCRDVEPEIARADAWARECEDRDIVAAEAAETAAVEGGEPEPSAYDQDPDIDEPEEADRG